VADILARIAQWEREIIGERTSAALQVKLRQGWEPHRQKPVIPVSVRRKILRLHEAGVRLDQPTSKARSRCSA
jgi:DNA invertase Pin-like site-specific DNA recombinase